MVGLIFACYSYSFARGLNFSDNTVADIVERVGPSVVNIVSKKNIRTPGFRRYQHGLFDYFFSVPNNVIPQKGEGSGFIFDASGLILTNFHVVEGADEIEVSLDNGKVYKAILHGSDSRRDIAILKIQDKNFSGKFLDSQVAKLGDSTSLRVGEFVVAIGSPFSLDRTVTLGIVSAKGRSLDAGDNTDYNNLIQTDASINPGNSGGPLLNIYGEVIGINTAISRAGQGIGFAIPINLAKRIASDVSKFGKVRRSWLGVEMSNVDQESYRYLGLPNPRGVVLRRVLADTPASRAGLQVGDVILKMNGTLIENASILVEKIQEVPVGEEALMEVMRKGKNLSLSVRLDEQGSQNSASPPALEFVKLKPLTDADRNRLSLENSTHGVLVEALDKKSQWYFRGLRVDDVIVQINQIPVRDENTASRLLSQNQGKFGTLVVLIREGFLTYLEM